MDYFASDFFDRYTALTEEQIRGKLTPVPMPGGKRWPGMAGQRRRLILDSGKTLDYDFIAADLILREDGAEPIAAPYAARELGGVVLVTHMVPDTLRGRVLVLDERAGLCTVFDVWFGSFEPDKREVWREFTHGVIAADGPAPEARHCITNRVEGTGTHWVDDDGGEWLYFFPSVVWSSFVELSNPRAGITKTAPSDYIRLNDRQYIYSRVEQEFSGAFTLEVIDLFELKHIGVHLGFDLADALVYRVDGGRGELTGRSTNLEPLTDMGTELPLRPEHVAQISARGRGARPSYRPRFMHRDFTQAEVDELVATNLRLFENSSIMSSRNTMEQTDALSGRRLTLRFDDGMSCEYAFIDAEHVNARADGSAEWHEELCRVYEPAKDLFLFAHICTGSRPLRCLTHVVDFSNGLVTCVDARLGNGRKPWEVGHQARFGVLETAGGPTPPAVKRHGFTRELLGKAFSWCYGDAMQSIHVYSTPESYSWTIMLPNNAGGWMWSSPCFYVKLRRDCWLMSWTEDGCNGNQGVMVINPRIMHDAGFFFGIDDLGEKPDVHLHEMGAYARPLAGFDLERFFEEKQAD